MCYTTYYIIDYLGSAEEELHNNTSINECYIVYHAITMWQLSIKVEKRILLKLKAGDILSMNENIYHSRRLDDTL